MMKFRHDEPGRWPARKATMPTVPLPTVPLLSVALLTVCLLVTLAGPEMAVAENPVASQEPSRSLREELRETVGVARDQVFPALVSIEAVTVEYRRGKELKGQAVGSGTIISETGLVVTNEHVTHNGIRFLCTLSDKRQLSATLVGEDPLTDLALLQLDIESLKDQAEVLPVARFGSSADLEIGDVVMAMGSPYALSRSVSLGIVSNTERVFAGGFGSDDLEEMELGGGQRTGLFTRWIQHDAVISPGNSGGPLVNLAGEIVGVNELGGSTLSFAIPSDLAQRVVAALATEGEVDRSFWGMSIKPIRRTGIDEGVLISSITVEGPADRAGVQAGDVLVALEGEPLTVRFVEEVPLLLDRLAGVEVGSSHQLTLQRGDELVDVSLVTEKLDKDVGKQSSFHDWGFTAQGITPKMARDFRLGSTEGARITGVRQGSPAQQAEPPLERGDIVRAVGQRSVSSLEDLIEIFSGSIRRETGERSGDPGENNGAEKSQDRGPESVVLEFDRRGTNQLTVLVPDRRDTEDPPRELPKAWIGVATQPVMPPLSAQMGLADVRGLRITRVYPGTEAEKADLRVGDVVTSLNGQPLTPAGMEDSNLLVRQARDLEIDGLAQLGLRRGDRELEVSVQLERTRLSPVEARRHTDRDFELTVRELTFFDRDERRWDSSVRGVLTETVDSGGWAGLGGVRKGDLILRIGDDEIKGLKSFRRALEAASQDRPERVVFVVLRGSRTYFQFIEPDWAPPSLADAEAGGEE